MSLTKSDKSIAEYYGKLILKPIRCGENAIFFWWPGSGMTTIVNDIIGDKSILKSNLGNLVKSIKIITFSGHLVSSKNLNDLLLIAGYKNETEILISTQKLVNEGSEIVFILNRVDDYSNKEKIKILQLFTKLVSINTRRVHLIFNTIDKPWFEKHLEEYKESLILANTMQIIPILKDNLLQEYINETAKKYNLELTENESSYIANTYGGILQLAKEYLRSFRDTTNLDVKFHLQWELLPKEYKEVIKQLVQGEKVEKIEILTELEKIGVLKLDLFNKHSQILDINPEKKVLTVFTEGEISLWKYFKQNSRKLILKDTVAKLLRPENNSDTTLWTIDKAVSRFRRKLLNCGIDPEKLKTIKGKGYIWQD